MEIASGVSLGSSPPVCGGYFVEKTWMHVGFFESQAVRSMKAFLSINVCAVFRMTITFLLSSLIFIYRRYCVTFSSSFFMSMKNIRCGFITQQTVVVCSHAPAVQVE